MAGDKTTPKTSPASKRVSKAATKSSPSSGSGSPSSRVTSYTGTADAKLTLLYMCFKHKPGNIDFKEVAKAYNITATAAQYRFYRLRDFMEKQDLPGKNRPAGSNDDDDKDMEVYSEVEDHTGAQQEGDLQELEG